MIKLDKKGEFESFDEDRVRALVAGEVSPQTGAERDLISFIGGVKPKPWPEKWVSCALCQVEWKTRAFPGRGGEWRWASICQPCADRYDAGLHPRSKPAPEKKPERKISVPYKD